MKSICIFLILFIFISSINSFSAIIHGFVRAKESKEPIVMANVWLSGTQIGTTTNIKGYYVLSSLPPGDYHLNFRYVGYKFVVINQKLDSKDDITLDVLLEQDPIDMKGIVISADRDQRPLDIRPSQITIQMPQLRNIPQIAEPDLFRSLQMLPGVATLSDFSAGLYIRGGSPDQNLILLDHIDVYNPNHLFGFFSTFNTDAIKSVELLKGGFPVNYGGRLSSVLNVINKEGNREKFQGVARVSMLSASATLEGPWKKGSWMLSGRRTYLDLAAKLAKMDLPYYFYDAHAKINYDINKNNLVSLSFYFGDDFLNLNEDGNSIKLNWGNKTFSTQWTHLFSAKFFSHFVFAGSQFHSKTNVEFDEASFGINNGITDLSLKGILSYAANLNHTMDFGFEVKNLDFGLKYHIVGTDYNNSFAGDYMSLYLQDNFRLNVFNILQTGLRLDHYSDGNYSRIAPRLSFKHILTDRMNLTLTYGQYHQFLNLVQREGFSFADMWFPVDKSFEPGAADHYSLGFFYDDKRSFSVDIEPYYKKYRNIAEYRTFRAGDEDLNHQTAAQNFLHGRGEAYGVDIYVRNDIWGIKGWIGYSLAWTKKQVKGYNLDQEYYPTYDRRHSIMILEDYHINHSWRINFAFKFGSGQPYTEATARYALVDPSGRIYYETLNGKKNFYRLPTYHRLDIGIFHDMQFFKWPVELFIQAVNVYNQKNVWYRRYQLQNNPATIKDYTQIPFLPSAGISIRF